MENVSSKLSETGQRCEKLREDIAKAAAAIDRPEILEKLRYVARCMLFAEPD